MPSELSVIENLVLAVEKSLEVTTTLNNKIVEIEKAHLALIAIDDRNEKQLGKLEDVCADLANQNILLKNAILNQGGA